MAAVLRSSSPSTADHLLDRAGIGISVVCLIQCIALSVTIVLAPFVSLGVFGSDLFHRILLALIVAVSAAAFTLGYRGHRRASPVVVGFAGLTVLVSAAFLEAYGLPPLRASLVTSIGGLLLIAAHWQNLRARRCARLRPDV
jgi:Flp pilus assembly protein TadB